MQKLKLLGVNKAEVEFAAKVMCKAFSGRTAVDRFGPDKSEKGLYDAFVSYMSMYEADYEPDYKAHTLPALTPFASGRPLTLQEGSAGNSGDASTRSVCVAPCNHILVLNRELGKPENFNDLTAGLEGGGWLVLNLPETSSRTPAESPSRAQPDAPINFDRFAGYRLAFVDAAGIVASAVGRGAQGGMAQARRTYSHDPEMLSCCEAFAMLGAFSRVLGEPPLAEIKRVLADDLDIDRKQGCQMADTEVALKILQGGYNHVTIHGFVPRSMSYGKLS